MSKKAAIPVHVPKDCGEGVDADKQFNVTEDEKKVIRSRNLYATICTGRAPASNNHGDSGVTNIKPMQFMSDHGIQRSIVTGDAMRFSYRHFLQEAGYRTNRVYSPYDNKTSEIGYRDRMNPSPEKFIDDDVMGYLSCDEKANVGKRGVLEVSYATSLAEFENDQTFHSTSGVKDKTSIHQVEMQCTAYQYPMSVRCYGLRNPSIVLGLLEAAENLNRVGGNQSRVSYDFSPKSVVLCVTKRPAHGFMYCFQEEPDGTVCFTDQFLTWFTQRDLFGRFALNPSEFAIGGSVSSKGGDQLRDAGLDVSKFAYMGSGIKAAFQAAELMLRGQAIPNQAK